MADDRIWTHARRRWVRPQMTTLSETNLRSICALALSAGTTLAFAAEAQRNVSQLIPRGPLPYRVHVFEDYETEIEKRWWLRGVPETNNLAPSLFDSIANHRTCRATATKDFDDKMGDPKKDLKGVIFNPVPGPPMGANTRLSFRYWLQGTDALRVQIYSLSKGYHRFLTLTNLPQGSWQTAAVDMTQARRPDGRGGPLSEDERIDDIQFYITPEAELLIDDIVLYESAPAGEARPFPRRVIFTGWFDTGKQGAGQEWPGDFEIVKHDPPLKWKAARSVTDQTTGQSWIRVHLRGRRALSEVTNLCFHYRLTGNGPLHVILKDTTSGREWRNTLLDVITDRWVEATVEFKADTNRPVADEMHFLAQPDAQLLVDDVLLFER